MDRYHSDSTVRNFRKKRLPLRKRRRNLRHRRKNLPRRTRKRKKRRKLRRRQRRKRWKFRLISVLATADWAGSTYPLNHPHRWNHVLSSIYSCKNIFIFQHHIDSAAISFLVRWFILTQCLFQHTASVSTGYTYITWGQYYDYTELLQVSSQLVSVKMQLKILTEHFNQLKCFLKIFYLLVEFCCHRFMFVCPWFADLTFDLRVSAWIPWLTSGDVPKTFGDCWNRIFLHIRYYSWSWKSQFKSASGRLISPIQIPGCCFSWMTVIN